MGTAVAVYGMEVLHGNTQKVCDFINVSFTEYGKKKDLSTA
jgi:UDP-galactopyranose mutase